MRDAGDSALAGSSRTLSGKTALITGSTQGLGLAAAERFAQAGCNIVFNGLTAPAQIAGIQRDIEARCGVRTWYSGADLRHPSEIEQLVSSAVDVFGGVDILVNNAVVPARTLQSSRSRRLTGTRRWPSISRRRFMQSGWCCR